MKNKNLPTTTTLIAELDVLVDHLTGIEKMLEKLARYREPRLAVINALGEIDTGLRSHATQLANTLAEESGARGKPMLLDVDDVYREYRETE